MLKDDLYVQAIEAIYASGLEGDLIPAALAATSRLLGASGVTLEVIDKATQQNPPPRPCRRSRYQADATPVSVFSKSIHDESLPHCHP